jgi:hypothetical protein
MRRTIVSASAAALAVVTCPLAVPSRASEPGPDSYMVRVLACAGPDANMEVYLPQSIMYRDDAERDRLLSKPVTGMYALDLTAANKGKVLEPVRVRLSADKRSVVIEQYTRKLPATSVPLAGGTVDFDKRFGSAAKCGPFAASN